MPDSQFDAEIAALRRVQADVVSSANRLLWRAAMQHRMVRVAAVLRTLPTLMISRVSNRSKGSKGWLVSVDDSGEGTVAVLEVVTWTRGRTLEELAAPLPIRVLRPDLIVLRRLEELVLAGTVTVQRDELPP